VANPDLDDLLDTCCVYVDLQRRLIAQAVTTHTAAPAVVIAMHAALEQLETAVVNICHPERLHLWLDPGE
jgi:precorrin-6B methylase 2